MFSCTRGEKESRCCLLKCSAAGCLKMYVYINNQILQGNSNYKNTLAQFHDTTSFSPTIQSVDYAADFVANSSFRMG